MSETQLESILGAQSMPIQDQFMHLTTKAVLGCALWERQRAAQRLELQVVIVSS